MTSNYKLFESSTKRSLSFLNSIRQNTSSPFLFHMTPTISGARSLMKYGLHSPIGAAQRGIKIDSLEFENPSQRYPSDLTKKDADKTLTPLSLYKQHNRKNYTKDIPSQPEFIRKGLLNKITNPKIHDSDLEKMMRQSVGGGKNNSTISVSKNKPFLSYGKQGIITTRENGMGDYIGNNFDGLKVFNPQAFFKPESKKRGLFDKIEQPSVKPKALVYTPSPDEETRKMVREAKEKGQQTIPLNKKINKYLDKHSIDDKINGYDKFK